MKGGEDDEESSHFQNSGPEEGEGETFLADERKAEKSSKSSNPRNRKRKEREEVAVPARERGRKKILFRA